MTRQEEQHVIDKFREQYKDLPNGKISQKPPPWTDFVLTTSNGVKIGIELTQAVHSESAKQDSSDKENFTDLVLANLTSLLPFPFSISVSLFKGIGIPKSEKNIIAIEVANFCQKEFLYLKNMTHVRVEHVGVDINSLSPETREHFLNRGFRNLPKGVKSIGITRFDEHRSSFNSHSEGAAIPYFSKERLDERLAVKETKIPSYEPCDEYWLIIWQGGWITGYFQEGDIEIPIQSKFNKVFIIRTIGDIIILKP